MHRAHLGTVVSLVVLVAGGCFSPPLQDRGAAGPHPQPLVPLTVSIVAAPTSGPPPLLVTLGANVTGGVSPYVLAWQFGDGSPSDTAANLTHTFVTYGSFVVRLNVTDYYGATANGTLTITVAPAVLVLAAQAVPAVVARGSTVLFESSVSGGVPPYHYAWTGLPPGCPAEDVENYSCQPTASGTFSVSVTVTDAFGASNSSGFLFVVTGSSAPPPGGSAGAPDWSLVGVLVLAAAVATALGLILGRRWRRRLGR